MVAVCTWLSGTVTAGRAGNASFSGIVSPSMRDIFAIHKVGEPYADFVAWQYTNDFRFIPYDLTLGQELLPGLSAGATTFYIPVTAVGSHTARILSGLTGDLIAESSAFTINAYDNIVTITPTTPASINSNLHIAWTGIPTPLLRDWIGIFNYNSGVYALNNQPLLRINTGFAASGSVDLWIPNSFTPGNYEARLFAGVGEGIPMNQTPVLYIKSGQIVISNTSMVQIDSPGACNAGNIIDVTWRNIVSPVPNINDWIGLYLVGAADTNNITWRNTDGLATSSVPFQIPSNLLTNNYNFRLFSGIDKTKIADSTAFVITAV